MQTYIAAAGDTLRKMAIRYHFQIESLQALNPHIPGIDGNITPGTLVHLPSPGIQVKESFEIWRKPITMF
jgi:LysM repeat protein